MRKFTTLILKIKGRVKSELKLGMNRLRWTYSIRHILMRGMFTVWAWINVGFDGPFVIFFVKKEVDILKLFFWKET